MRQSKRNPFGSAGNRAWALVLLALATVALMACVPRPQPMAQPDSPLFIGKYRYYTPYVVGPAKCFTNPGAQRFGQRLIEDPNQKRNPFFCDDRLVAAAQWKALDMATRGYVAHDTPEGWTPNQMVRFFGCNLPSDYLLSGNNVESIAGGMGTADAAYDALKNSEAHRNHLEGSPAMFSKQHQFGVGFVARAGTKFTFYWVFLAGECDAG